MIIYTTLAFVAGILLASQFSLPVWLVFGLLCICLLISVFWIFKKQTAGPLILILTFLLGILRFGYTTLPPAQNDISNFISEKTVEIVGVIENEPRFREEIASFNLKVESLNDQKVTGVIQASCKSRVKYGDKLKLKGKLAKIISTTNPDLTDLASYYESQGIRSRFLAFKSKPKILGNRANPFNKFLFEMRKKFVEVHKKTLPDPYASLLASILFGVSAGQLDPALNNKFRDAGVLHLIVVSGQHLSILAGMCFTIFKFIKLPQTVVVGLASTVNILFAFMVGLEASVMRALVMTELTLLGQLFERENEVYTSIAAAALFILVLNPQALFKLGFQFSFLATWSLIYLSPMLAEFLSKYLPKPAAVILATAAAPVMLTTPVSVYHFSQLVTISILANIILIPVVSYVSLLGFMASFAGIAAIQIAEIINGANFILLKITEFFVNFFSGLPFGQRFLAAPSIPLVIGYYGLLFFGIQFMRQTFDRKNLKILVLFVIAVLVWHAAAADGSDGLAGKLLTVTFIDVGQGDSILAELACGKNMLIDAGGVMGSDSKNSYIGEKIVTAFLHRKGINKLDLLVLTHPHEDHAGGLTALLENIKVETVIDSGQLSSTRAYHNFLKLIKKNEIKYRLGRCGQVLNFGDGIQGWILSPLEPFLEGTNSDLNNNSIVIRLLYNKVGFMFTGDLEREGEARILAAGLPLFSQILKAGHHGSQTASGSEFLDSVKPQIAVISVGTNNQFHHPHKPVLERLKERAIKIYRTDQQGAVTVKTDGERYMVETAK